MGRANQIVYGIPGGWYGNDPGYLADDPFVGNVTVDPARADSALAWLRKRAVILSTRLTADANPGLFVQYLLRRSRRSA